MLSSLAIPFPAISKAVPWSTDVRMIGRPRVTLTPESKADVSLIVVHGYDDVVYAFMGL